MSRASLGSSGRVGVLGILLAMLALAALPAGATAKPGRGDSEMRERATIRFQGSNGYRFEVAARAGQGDLLSGFVSVIAKSGPSSVRYLVPGSLASDGSLNVHLPHVGRIAVKFDPTTTTRRRPPARCMGRARVVERGFFRGTIELHGERDYTMVDRTSARGRVIRSSRKSCGRGTSAERSASGDDTGNKGAFTLLAAGVRKGSLNVLAMKFVLPTRSGTFISAEKRRFREGMLITSGVGVKAGAADFVVPDPGESKIAELKPPAPFQGTARFELTSPKTSTWRGDLAVELPGVGSTHLAGQSFESTLCQRASCTDTAPGPTGEAADFVAGIFG